MAVYVDALFPCVKNMKWRYDKSCHLVADTVEELHVFAASIGLRRSWFQGKSLPHYDLTKNKRAQAVKTGAIEVGVQRFVEIMRKYKPRKAVNDKRNL